MTDLSTLKLEPVRPEQLDGLAELHARSARTLGDPLELSRQDLETLLTWERIGPSGVLSVMDDERIVGLLRYGRFLDAREPTVLAIVTVEPEFRDAGVADWVYEQVRSRARADGAVYLDTVIDSRDRDAREFVTNRGFKELVSIWTLEADPDFAPGEAPRPRVGFRVRPYVVGQDAPLVAGLINKVFAQHASFAPVSATEMTSLESHPAFSAALTFFLEADTGDTVAFARNTLRGDHKDAWIDMLGVAPDHQGRGLGRFTLLQCMYVLARHRPRAIRLNVEGTNERARALYDSEGFMELRTRIRFRRSLSD
jgi:mycothiol synthase